MFYQSNILQGRGEHYCKHDHYSCPCWWCVKQTQAEEAGSVREGNQQGRWQSKVGKAKMWGYAMALLFFLGDACLKQWQRGRWGWGQELAQVRWQLCC